MSGCCWQLDIQPWLGGESCKQGGRLAGIPEHQVSGGLQPVMKRQGAWSRRNGLHIGSVVPAIQNKTKLFWGMYSQIDSITSLLYV